MKRLFFTGLITLLPIALTIVVIIIIFNLLTTPFQGLMEDILSYYGILDEPFLFLSKAQVLQGASKLMAAALLLALILTIGILGRLVILNALFSLGNAIIEHIPLVNKIYKVVKEAVESLFGSKGSSFSQAVLVPYPSADAYSLGLIPKDQKKKDSDLFVFIPSALNPTFGYMISYKKEDLIYLDISIEEAIKFAVSCGIMFEGFKESSR